MQQGGVRQQQKGQEVPCCCFRVCKDPPTRSQPHLSIAQLYNSGPLEGPHSVLGAVLWTWVAGSCWFTAGGCFLAYRHFVMGVV